MAITKRPTTSAASSEIERFIEAAPDGASGKIADKEKDGVQITLRLSREQLDRLNKIAERQGIPRASYIKRAVFIQLDADERTQA